MITLKCNCGKILTATSESQMAFNLGIHKSSTYHKRFTKINEFSKCQNCGTEGEIIYIHHKDIDHSNNHKDNLMYVCAFCHTKIHKEIGYKNPKYKKEVKE